MNIFHFAAIVFFAAPSALMGSLIPTAWSLGTSVATFGPGGTTHLAIFTTVQPRFHNQHSLTFAGSTVSAQYDVEITEAMANYNIQAQMTCVNVNNDIPTCTASGNFTITPRTDVWVEATGSYAYSLPTDPSFASMKFTVIPLDPPGGSFGGTQTDNTFLTGPHSGMFNLNNSGPILAGTRVQVSYSFRTDFATGAANVSAASSGNIHITLTAVPEPGALALLALATLPLMRRRP